MSDDTLNDCMNGLDIPNKMWITLRECCELKGLNYKTASNNKSLRPGEEYSHRVGGRKVFRRDVVINWLLKTDDQLK